MNVLLYFAACFLLAWFTEAQDAPQITSNVTTVDVSEDGIAHFTCSARGHPTPSISWQRSGKTLTNKDKGVEILSNKDSQLVSSHLFVAVTHSDHRGSYVCVASNTHGETRKTFLIKDEPSSELTRTDYIAIGLGSGLTLAILGFIIILLRIKIVKERRKQTSENPGTAAEAPEAHDNPMIQESDEITTPL